MGKIIDDEKNEVDEMSDTKQNDLFYTLLSGKTITEEIDTSRGKFIAKFPKQKDLLSIDRRVAALRGGIPATSFDEQANFNIQKIAFLDVVIIGGEKWYENIKSNKDKNFSWGDMPDSNFVDEVWLKAWTFRNKIQEKLKPNASKTDSELSDDKELQTSMDDGLFSGIDNTNK